MSLPFELMYLVGFTPWDSNQPPSVLRNLIEGPEALRAGRALDLGCGFGSNAIYLAQHGWAVTGVDAVRRALRTARRRATNCAAAVQFVQGDVTRLDRAGLVGPFDLLLDSGCYHGMSEEERDRYGESTASIAAPVAQLLMFAFCQRALGLIGPRGAEREDVERSFGARWELVWTVPDHRRGRLDPERETRGAWYRLSRRASTPAQGESS